jgi:hypothetical protein
VSGVYDSDLADRSVRELAVVTDADLGAGIRTAYAELVELAKQRRRVEGWPGEYWEKAAYAVLLDGRDAVAGLSDDVLLAAVSPVLGQWWPDQSPRARAVAGAVRRLRTAVKIRPRLVVGCRRLTSGD